MGIVTVFVFAAVVFIPTAIYEGCVAIHNRAKEAREWRKIKRIYF